MEINMIEASYRFLSSFEPTEELGHYHNKPHNNYMKEKNIFQFSLEIFQIKIYTIIGNQIDFISQFFNLMYYANQDSNIFRCPSLFLFAFSD